ncbi:MAG: hypothetical protein ACOC4H_03180, partial [bacterium]
SMTAKRESSSAFFVWFSVIIFIVSPGINIYNILSFKGGFDKRNLVYGEWKKVQSSKFKSSK